MTDQIAKSALISPFFALNEIFFIYFRAGIFPLWGKGPDTCPKR